MDTGISQKEVAERLSYSPQRVNNYFRDIAEPPFEFLEKFRTTFSIDLRKLLEKEEKGIGLNAYAPIPVFDLELKDVADLNFFDHSELVIFYMDVPFYSDCFAGLRVTGSAMSPAYNSGDIVTLKRIQNFDTIPFGEAFLIITDEQRLIRYIRRNDKDPKTFILKAESADADDIVIKRADIKYLFQVKGKMTKN